MASCLTPRDGAQGEEDLPLLPWRWNPDDARPWTFDPKPWPQEQKGRGQLRKERKGFEEEKQRVWQEFIAQK